jgi:PPP family 3-phenylpropionic acid transporter
MTKAGINTFRIEANYAAVQSSYFSSACILNVFIAVYLSFKGLTNTQIGLTSSLLFIISIFLQVFVSNFADAHAHIPLKKIVAILYIIAVTACTIIWLLPIPIAIIIIVYSIAAATQRSVNGLINALMMQFSNIGLPVRYGWPRGIGSIFFALSAYIIGIVVENYSPDILMPIYIVFAIIAIISVSIMPNPNKLSHQYQPQIIIEEKVEGKSTSYREMIRNNPTLILFLCAVVLLFTGLSSVIVFMIRIIEALGGGARELGISMFIHSSVEMPMLFASIWILKKFKTHDILVFSFFCFFIRGLATYFAPSVETIYWIMAFNIFCVGLYAFGSVVFVNSITKASEKVRAQSLVIVCHSIGGIVGGYLGGSIIDSMGIKFLLTVSWIILLAAALIMLVCRHIYTKQFPAKTHNY